MDPRYQLLTAGQVATDAADNATATATATPHTGSTGAQGKLIGLGLEASFDAAVAAIKDLTVSFTDVNGDAQVLTFSWDFTAGPLVWSFAGPLTAKIGTAIVATLEASGAGGTTGTLILHYAEF